MINRIASSELIKLATQYKIVGVIGPRQSGKTTLVRDVFKNKPYVNLENPDIRHFAIEDPRGFLAQHEQGAIFDEAQRAPELFSYLQQLVDERDETAQYILTGSNNFLLQENISQSLAGRIGYLSLLPFSLVELPKLKEHPIDEILFKGMYPPLYDRDYSITQWYANYIRTYIERDVRQIKTISNLFLFERFLKLCAGRVGQLLNVHNLAIETGVDSKTINSWIGILEGSFILYRLPPHFKNFNKRVVKMPKLYFYDTGLVCAILGIQSADQLYSYPLRGSLFENFCIGELVKGYTNQAKKPNLYFWRDNVGHEVDVIVDKAQKLFPIEIKSGKTITNEYFKGLNFWNKITASKNGIIIYGGDMSRTRSNGQHVMSWKNLDEIIAEYL